MPRLTASKGRPGLWFETVGDRSKDPLVLLHGFAGTHRTWDALSERLAERQFLILPDLPGHGRSATSPSRVEMGIGPTSDAVAEAIRTAAGEGTRRVALLGYSLGGRVALDLACKHQELLSCLILEGASPGIELEDEREERRARDGALADEIERRGVEWFADYWQETPLFATQKCLPQPVLQRLRRDRLSNTARGLAMSLRAAGPGEMVPLWNKMETLRMPVLLVVGRRDARYAAAAEAMRRRIHGSLVAEVEGAGHCVHLEKPEEFADLVELFQKDRSAMMRAAEK
jgi:2-succinyl-6-hydroxy-2,4-cyclohexadiene-1-carboxylate synthase